MPNQAFLDQPQQLHQQRTNQSPPQHMKSPNLASMNMLGSMAPMAMFGPMGPMGMFGPPGGISPMPHPQQMFFGQPWNMYSQQGIDGERKGERSPNNQQ